MIVRIGTLKCPLLGAGRSFQWALAQTDRVANSHILLPLLFLQDGPYRRNQPKTTLIHILYRQEVFQSSAFFGRILLGRVLSPHSSYQGFLFLQMPSKISSRVPSCPLVVWRSVGKLHRSHGFWKVNLAGLQPGRFWLLNQPLSIAFTVKVKNGESRSKSHNFCHSVLLIRIAAVAIPFPCVRWMKRLEGCDWRHWLMQRYYCLFAPETEKCEVGGRKRGVECLFFNLKLGERGSWVDWWCAKFWISHECLIISRAVER